MRNSESPLFQFNTSPVRTVMKGGEPWFVGGDICDILDLRNTGNVFGRLTEGMKGIQIVPTLGGEQSMTRSEKGTHKVCTLGIKSEKGTSNVGTLGETQSIQELEISAKRECKPPTLGTTQSIQRLEDLEKGTRNVGTLGGDQSMTIISKSGTEDTT